MRRRLLTNCSEASFHLNVHMIPIWFTFFYTSNILSQTNDKTESDHKRFERKIAYVMLQRIESNENNKQQIRLEKIKTN